MGLFATAEEKQQKQDEKKEKKFNQLIERYHLTDIGKEDYELIKNVCDHMSGTSLMELGVALSIGTKAEDQIKIDRLAALQEQNWIIINQLGRLNKNIKELIELNSNR